MREERRMQHNRGHMFVHIAIYNSKRIYYSYKIPETGGEIQKTAQLVKGLFCDFFFIQTSSKLDKDPQTPWTA